MTDVDLRPDRLDNLQMGYLFEHLVMRFNEQANGEAGDHFTPREVIRLMANLIYTGEQDVYNPGIYRTIYDPACGTGGMLSESEKLILSQNKRRNSHLFGQEYNDEASAICCSDMLITDEDTGAWPTSGSTAPRESGPAAATGSAPTSSSPAHVSHFQPPLTERQRRRWTTSFPR